MQLLAQTCSQIGADVGGNKLLQDKNSNNNNNTSNNDVIKSLNNKKSPALVVSDGGRTSSSSSCTSSQSPPTTVTSSKPFSFKPYEPDNIGKKVMTSSAPSPKASSVVSVSPGMSSSSPRPRKSPHLDEHKSATSSSSETMPVIRSGLEVLAGHPKDVPLGAYRHLASAGFDPSNPAFRPPFGMGYPPSSLAASLASLGVCRDPFCRDPTCPTALYNAQAQLASLSGAGGYADLLKAHQMAAAMAAAQGSGSASGLTPPNGLAGPGGPYICNWMNGREGYCGKRHSSAEELLQHLRTHTNLSTSDSAAAAATSSMLNSLYPANMFGGMNSSAAALASLHRAYGGAIAASNSLSASRFHPYAKPGGNGAGLAGLGMHPPPGMGSLPPSLAALGYTPSSLYALYGSRLNGSSVLP